MSKTNCRIFIAALCAGVLWARPTSEPVLAKDIPVAQPQLYRIGVSKSDITPPPGLSTGGHGPAASIARGTLTRLHIRMILLVAANDTSASVALISVEAFGVPSAFTSRAHLRLKQQHGIDLPLSSVLVAATHTHHGPGNFMSARMYNRLGSRIDGFDHRMRAFLNARLDQAVDHAVEDSRDSPGAALTLRTGWVDELAWRNRSPETFMLNRDAEAMMGELGGGIAADAAACEAARLEGEQQGAWKLHGCPRLRAVDRTVRVLDVSENGRMRAMAVFAAVHPTVVAQDLPLFSGDMTGVAMTQLERRHSTSDPSPLFVAAFFNGAQGDIVPRRVTRDVHDLWRHAGFLVDAVEQAAGASPMDLAAGIESAMHVAKAGDTLEGSNASLALRPQGGVAVLGGGEGDRMPFYDLGWREGVKAALAAKGQGTKLPALKSELLPLPDLTFLLATRSDFVQRIPLSYLRIGPMEVVATPSEISSAVGFRIRKALQNREALIVGLANEYVSYTATPEEYAAQDYMGASTFWGPLQGDFFAEVLARLKGHDERELLPERELSDKPGRRGRFHPYDVGEPRPHLDEDLDQLLRDRNGNPRRDLPCFVWHEATANEDSYEQWPRRVAVQFEGGKAHHDDEGNVVVLLTAKPSKGSAEWAATWAGQLKDHHPSNRARFVVTLERSNVEHRSTWFDTSAERGCVRREGTAHSSQADRFNQPGTSRW